MLDFMFAWLQLLIFLQVVLFLTRAHRKGLYRKQIQHLKRFIKEILDLNLSILKLHDNILFTVRRKIVNLIYFLDIENPTTLIPTTFASTAYSLPGLFHVYFFKHASLIVFNILVCAVINVTLGPFRYSPCLDKKTYSFSVLWPCRRCLCFGFVYQYPVDRFSEDA